MRIRMLVVMLVVMANQVFAEQESETRTCRILVLSKPGSVPKTLHLFDGLSSQEVELPTMNFSKVYHIATGPVNLRMLSSPVTDPKLVPAGAPSVIVPKSSKDIYLFVTSDSSNKVAPVKVAFVNADFNALGRGEMLWFNLTDNTVAGKVGAVNLNLKPGNKAVLKEPASGRESYPVELYFRVPGDDFVHPLCETQWLHDPRSRSIAIIMTEGNRRVPKIHSFADFRETEEEP